MIHGRLVLAAFDFGLNDVTESSARLVRVALETFLKNILTGAILLRRNFTLYDGHFMHNFGCEMPNSLRARPQLQINLDFPSTHDRFIGDLTELKHSGLASALRSIPATPLGLRDVLDALRSQPSLIPMQTIRSKWLERIVMALGHRSRDQLEAEDEFDEMAKRRRFKEKSPKFEEKSKNGSE